MGAGMRLTDIEARELLSFDTLRLGDLPQVLVVVGPNGAGKTNLLVLLRVVLAGLDRAASFSAESYRELVRLAGSRRIGAPRGRLSSVRLGIALTEPWERELLVAFVRAAVTSGLLRNAAGNADASAVIGWIREHVTERELAPLCEGSIVVGLADAAAGIWEVRFEFDVGGQRFLWMIEGDRSRGAIVREADAGRSDVPGRPVGQALALDGQGVPEHAFTMADVLPPAGEARMLTLEHGTQWMELTREFAALAGIPLSETERRGFSLANALHAVLGRGLALLGDLREPPRLDYAVEEAGFDPSPADGSRIPVRLFRLKNGSAADREQFSAIQDLFRRLTGRAFDVTLSTTMGNRGQESEPVLRISTVVDLDGQDLPVEFAGAGFWEALLLSATFPVSAGCVAVLDEPARNLHPTLQRCLLDEIRRAPGQFILTTHSPSLVPSGGDQNAVRIVRFGMQEGATRLRHLPEDSGPDSARLRKVLRESADARALLFARGVVLVEGGTEFGALPEWFAKSPASERLGTPDALNVVIFSVNGDPGFGTITGFLNAFGVPWAIVCDGAIYRFGTGKRQIFEQVLDAGVDDSALREAVEHADADGTVTFTGLRELGEGSGIFTLAEEWDSPGEGFEAFLDTEFPGSLDRAAKAVGRSKPRQGRHVAEATECPKAVDELYQKLLRHLGVIRAAGEVAESRAQESLPVRDADQAHPRSAGRVSATDLP